jgi:hypothetical protein
LISDYWTFVFGLAGAAGSIATAAALFFVGWQVILTRNQVRLTREQIGRAWIRAANIKVEFDQVILSCKNYGHLPAKILGVQACVSTMAQLTEPDIRAASTSARTYMPMIFPNSEYEFPHPLPVKLMAYQEITFWFGFIVQYEYRRSNEIETDEYGVLGEIRRMKTGAQEMSVEEWVERPGHQGMTNFLQMLVKKLHNKWSRPKKKKSSP